MSTNQSLKSSQPRDRKAFADHIGELRTRAVWVVLTFIITSAVAYNYRDILVQVVLAPLGDQKLVYLTPAGGFAFIFQVTMYAAAVVTAPLFVYQLYRFVKPALPKRASRHSVRVMLASVALMAAGVGFGYFVAVPAALHFLTAFAGTYIEASLTADSYLNFIVAYVVGLGLLFQLPLLLIFWNWINPMGPKKLLGSEKFVILFSFIAAALITPTPDPTNQAMIALPIIVIYQIGVIAVLIMNRSNRRASPSVRQQIVMEPSPVPVSPLLPELSPEPVPSEQTVVRGSAMQPVRMIDGVRRVRPMQRAESRLIAPSRSVTARRGRRGLSMDGVSRAPSA